MALLMIGLFILVQIVSFGGYLYRYFYWFPQHHSDSLHVGYDKTLESIEQSYPQEMIAVLDPEGFQYILTAWYLKLEPDVYFQTNVRQLPNSFGFRYGEKVTHYHFISREQDRLATEKILLEWKNNSWLIKSY